MKKFRLLSLALALAMTVTTFASCGGKGNENSTAADSSDTTAISQQEKENEDNSTEDFTETSSDANTSDKGYITSKEAFISKMSALIDISQYNELSESNTGTAKLYTYTIKSENKTEYPLDYKISLSDGTEFTMPITFAELEAKGWILQDNSDRETEIAPGFMSYGIIENSSGKSLHVAAYNPEESSIQFKDCTVVNTDFQQYSSFEHDKKLDSAIDFTLLGSITNTSKLEDIIAKLGNPSSIIYSEHYDSDGKYDYSTIKITYEQKSSAFSSIVFEISGDGNYILSVSYDVSAE